MNEKLEKIVNDIDPEKDFGILNTDLFHIINSIDELTQKDLLKQIEKDPNIAFRVLKTVNSPYYLLTKKIHSIDHALIYLGRAEVKKIILIASLIDISEKLSLSPSESSNFIDFSTRVADTCKRLMEHYEYSTIYHPEDGYIAGLMISLGKLILKSSFFQEVKGVSDYWISIDVNKDLERFDTDFIQISSYFLEKFHLEHIVESYKHIYDDTSDNFLSRSLNLSLNIVSLYSYEEDVVEVLEKKGLICNGEFDLKSGIVASVPLIEELIEMLRKD